VDETTFCEWPNQQAPVKRGRRMRRTWRDVTAADAAEIVRRVMAHEGYECVAQKFGIHKGIVQKLMDAAGQRVGQRGPKKRAI
jgi:hypothetical protein